MECGQYTWSSGKRKVCVWWSVEQNLLLGPAGLAFVCRDALWSPKKFEMTAKADDNGNNVGEDGDQQSGIDPL